MKEIDKHIFHIKGRGCDARGFYDSLGFTVLKGSIIASDSTPSMSWRDRDNKVKELTTEQNGKVILSLDKTFSSPSTAAIFCMGRNTNGWIGWQDEKGKTLDDVYRKQLEG